MNDRLDMQPARLTLPLRPRVDGQHDTLSTTIHVTTDTRSDGERKGGTRKLLCDHPEHGAKFETVNPTLIGILVKLVTDY